MTTQRIGTGQADLSPVLGTLSVDEQSELVERLLAADTRLGEVVEWLNEQTGGGWTSNGVIVETEVSGQAAVDALIEDEQGTLTFSAQLRPRNFFGSEASPWRPGLPPMVMATDAWDVDGSVDVRFRTRVAGRPYTIQEQVVELAERRYESAAAAVAAFAEACEELAALALSREPTVAAWRPEPDDEPGSSPA